MDICIIIIAIIRHSVCVTILITAPICNAIAIIIVGSIAVLCLAGIYKLVIIIAVCSWLYTAWVGINTIFVIIIINALASANPIIFYFIKTIITSVAFFRT